MFTYYWKILDMFTGEHLKSLPEYYHSLESAKRAVRKYIVEYLPDNDPEDIMVGIYEAGGDNVIDRLVYCAPRLEDYYALRSKSGGLIDDISAEKRQELREKGIGAVEHLISMKLDQYSWIIMDWATGDYISSRKSFRNAADAKESLKMRIRRIVAKGRDPEDLRFQVTKYSPKTGRTEIVYADPRNEEGKRLLDQYKEHMLSEWDVKGSDEEERKRLIELVEKIRKGSVVSIYGYPYEEWTYVNYL